MSLHYDEIPESSFDSHPDGHCDLPVYLLYHASKPPIKIRKTCLLPAANTGPITSWCLLTKKSLGSVFLLLHICHQTQELPSWRTWPFLPALSPPSLHITTVQLMASAPEDTGLLHPLLSKQSPNPDAETKAAQLSSKFQQTENMQLWTACSR